MLAQVRRGTRVNVLLIAPQWAADMVPVKIDPYYEEQVGPLAGDMAGPVGDLIALWKQENGLSEG